MSSFAECIIHPDAPAARTTTGTGTVFTAINNRGGIFSIDITAVSGTTPTLVVKLQGTIDGVNWYDIDTTGAQTASLNTTGTAKFTIYPGLVAAANSVSNNVIPMNLRFSWTIGGTTPSFTFGTHADLIM